MDNRLRSRIAGRMLWAGIGLVVLYWILESFMDAEFQMGGFVGRLLPRDANELWMRCIIVGLILAFSAYIQVTAQRRGTEQALRQSQWQLQAILDNSTAVVYLKDSQGRYILINRQLETLFHVDREQLVGKTDYDVFPKETADAFRANDRQVLESGEPLELEEVAPQDDGMHTYISVKFPVYNSARVPYAVCGISTDITERKRVEVAQRFLAEASALLASSLEYETTLGSVTRLAVPRVADWCAVDIVDEDGDIRRLAVAHEDPSKVELAEELQRRYPTDPHSQTGVPKVLHTGQADFYPDIPDSLLVSAARDAEHLNILREVGMKSAMIVPLVARGRTLGAISFVSADSGHHYDATDLAMAEDLARRAALAIDNARLYGDAQEEILERKRTEEELHRQTGLYETLLQTQSDVGEGFIIAEGQRIVYANEAFCQFSGHTPEELMALHSFEGIVVPEEAPLLRERLDGRMRGEDVSDHYETAITHKSGRRVDLEVAVKAFQAGDRTQLIVIVRDITERKRAREALLESETRFRTMIEQSPLSIQIFSPDGRTVRVNRAWEELWGVTLDQIPGYNVLQDPQLVEKGMMPYIERGFAGQATEIPPVKYVPDETIPNVSEVAHRWVRAFIYPVKDVAGTVQEVVLIHEDVTERKRAEEALRSSEANLATGQAITHLGSWEYDPYTHVTRWSDEFYRILGFSPQEVVPSYERFLERIHPEDREHVNVSIAATLHQGKQCRLEHRVLRPDGSECVVQDQCAAATDATGRLTRVFGTMHDITDRKQAEAQRDALLVQVEHDLEFRNRFLSITSHELKTPITLLKGYADVLNQRAQADGNAAMLGPLQVISRQVDRMTRLIDELLDVSRMESDQIEFEMSPFELNTALEEVIGEVATGASGFALRVDEQAEGLWVRGDRARIQQVMINLLTNAIKYSGERKDVDITLKREGADATVSVRDYGIGIPKQQQPTVFELYFRGANASKDKRSGLGLGLYISKSIVERHRGEIGVTSEEGKGSTFYLLLPTVSADLALAGSPRSTGQAGQTETSTRDG